MQGPQTILLAGLLVVSMVAVAPPAAAVTFYAEDFTFGAPGWTFGGFGPLAWTVTTCESNSFPFSLGALPPFSCPMAVFGSPTVADAMPPPVAIPSGAVLVEVSWASLHEDPGPGPGATERMVFYSLDGGATWQTGASEGDGPPLWHGHSFSLALVATEPLELLLQFHYVLPGGALAGTWFIDDLEVSALAVLPL